jgi:WD40 repeat protein
MSDTSNVLRTHILRSLAEEPADPPAPEEGEHQISREEILVRLYRDQSKLEERKAGSIKNAQEAFRLITTLVKEISADFERKLSARFETCAELLETTIEELKDRSQQSLATFQHPDTLQKQTTEEIVDEFMSELANRLDISAELSRSNSVRTPETSRETRCGRTLEGHNRAVESVSWSRDGELLASGSFKELKLWEINSGDCLHTLTGHSNYVRSVAFSYDKRKVASGSYEEIKIWDVRYGDCLRTLTGHQHSIISLKWKMDGQVLASASADHTVKLWDVNSGDCLQTLSGHWDYVYTMAWYNDDRLIASGSSDATIKLWDVETGKCTHTLQGHNGWVTGIKWSNSDSRLLASVSSDKTLRLWDVDSGKCVRTFYRPSSAFYTVGASREGYLYALGIKDKNVRMWDFETGRCLISIDSPVYRVNRVALNRDISFLATGNADKTISIWELPELKSQLG